MTRGAMAHDRGTQGDPPVMIPVRQLFHSRRTNVYAFGVQPSPNKVRIPLHACFLVAWTAKWLKDVAPRLFIDGTIEKAALSVGEPEILGRLMAEESAELDVQIPNAGDKKF